MPTLLSRDFLQALAPKVAPRRAIAARAAQSLETLGKDSLVLSKAATSVAALPTNFAKVSPGIFRGGAFETEAQFDAAMKASGAKTIVSLLDATNPKETALIALEQKLAAKNGIELHYLAMPFGKTPPAKSVSELLTLTARASDAAPIYLHCKLGRDRTGTMVAVHRMAHEGYSAEQAVGEMRRFGFDPVAMPYLKYLDDFVRGFGKTLAK